jgi:UPF0755 protein
MKKRNTCLPWILLLATLIMLSVVAVAIYVPQVTWRYFGRPNDSLNIWQNINYGFQLVWNSGDLVESHEPGGAEQVFIIQPGESVISISNRLEQVGLIGNAKAFRAYLLWSGLDTIIQSGTYRLRPGQSAIEIAQTLKSTTLTEVNFTVLAGWRMEEIAATIPTSGLEFTPETFQEAVKTPIFPPSPIPSGISVEGFLFPGTYIIPRTTTANQLVATLLQEFISQLPAETLTAFTSHGLTLYQAVTMASIVQREAVVDDEMPLIASVFYNRLSIGMKLQTDPTVQYALGYNSNQGTWWTNPLSMVDMEIVSPYNTYLYAGLPPGPISNPGITALSAIAYPAQSLYYYFQAKCDGSGLHNFSETLSQHQQNNCP